MAENKMEKKQLKDQMMRLWKETFSDSDSYINLVFDNYFNPETIVYHEENGNLISALLGVPYRFKNSDPDSPVLRGLYLCGLSTVSSHRNRGLMTELLDRINQKASDDGYDFTFLIPASDGLSQFYRDRGFVPAFYFFKEHFVSNHNFEWSFRKICAEKNDDLRIENFEKLNVLQANFEFSENGLLAPRNPNLLQNFISFLESFSPELINSKNEKSFSIFHSAEDWEIVIRENLISKDMIFICLDNSQIVGAAFVSDLNEPHVLVKKIITTRLDVKVKLLDSIKKKFPEHGVAVVSYVNEKINGDLTENQIWEPFYIHNNLPEAEYEDVSSVETSVLPQNCTQSFGMCRILNASEILKKVTNHSSDFKFSILANDENLLLRRPNHPDYVGQALDLPDLNLSAFLLLE